jgi:lantibiotic modifying enzyme
MVLLVWVLYNRVRLKMQSHQNTALSSWQPLLCHDEAHGVLQSLREIAEVLRDPDKTQHGTIDIEFKGQPFSLGSGSAGVAVFLAYLEKSGLFPDVRQSAFEQMNRAIEAVASQYTMPSLYGGFTGVGWAAEHVTKLLAESSEDLNSDLDGAVEQYVRVSPWKDDYDLISGLVGIGIYCLERDGSPGANHALELIVDRLHETAERSEDETTVTWFTPRELLIRMQTEKYPHGFYNLGVAHGVPGVIALLGRIYSSGIAREKTGWLLDRAVTWLLKQRLPAGANSSFADVIAQGATSNDCRLAWCYGDAGIAAALLLAARCTGTESWEAEALAIAQRSARRAPETCGVTDACVCHGSAGLAHIFNRIYQATQDQLYADTARFWLERTLQFHEPGKGAAGYLTWGMGEKEAIELQPKLGLIQGIAGIGLVLLAALSDVEPCWDRVFQMDVSPRRTLTHD